MGEPIVVTCEQCDGLGVTPKTRVSGTDLVVCEHQIVPQDCPYCELKRLRAELESERVARGPMSEWQDIETAPKDRRWVLVWAEHLEYAVYRFGPGLIDEEEPDWTHWMPLPSPPEVHK